MSDRAASRFSGQNVAVFFACFAIPAILFVAHLSQGADTLIASAWACLAAALALALVLLLHPFERLPASILLLTLLLGGTVAGGLTGNWYQARAEIVQLAAGLAFWSAGILLAQSRRLLGLCWTSLIAGIALFGVLALISYPLSATGYTDGSDTSAITRLSFSFGSPNVMASLMGVGAILSAVHITYLLRTRVASDIPRLAKISQMPRSGYISALALLICASCLLLSLSRAAITLTLGVLAVWLTIEIGLRARQSDSGDAPRRRRRPLIMLAVAAASVLLILLTLSSGQIGARSGALGTDSMGRWEIFSEYWAAWQEHPLFGFGLGSFNRVNESITTLDNAWRLVTMGAAHNILLQWLIQTGIVGTAIMVSVWLWMHGKIIRVAATQSNNSIHYIAIAALLVSVFLILHNLVDFSLEIPSIMWTYAFLLGLACGTSIRKRA
ncbi:O-antigen ligase family protein [Henriciella aquimarina]|uniref:O-antigen ligase family protein n=1 Tax=Henriciella aquimarina TaxID=545261 RepID=UPI000A070302|nr:O-antigen ligase family protein [Henriciella aquimarina]